MKKLIDLHLHLDGSVPVDTIKELMIKHEMPMLEAASLRKKLSVSPQCHDLNEFLEKFSFAVNLMQTAADLRLITFELLKKLKREGLVYVEIRFAPQLHTEQGLTQEEVVRAVISGLDQFLIWQKEQSSSSPDLHATFLLCLMRLKGNDEANQETVTIAKKFLGQGVSGLDLAGAEMLEFAIRQYAALFQEARAAQVPFTIHAGEAMGPESIREALALGAKRIGHGIRCIEDQALVDKLIADKITLECCATSNLNTKVFDQLDHYPVRRLLHEGVKVTLNSDDMTVSNINLPHEYDLLEEKTGLTRQDERQLYLNAVNAAFCSAREKERLLSLI
ncbi:MULTISPECIES: adenosine deaminase [Lactobacillus]|uniref:adenosine deaminase n=1 Tax=Lactobacillus xujianguonis TaxID=2495899 RepID=A0A437SUB0_9LACO|nr:MULTISPECIES: adenosine deaminase [Lactobacillus]RVU70470.1 adenosine deaminase [Lactobacillus xujianguonis]RVU76860.1 adenosine deaminase [Lactobacillus xujianguonis]